MRVKKPSSFPICASLNKEACCRVGAYHHKMGGIAYKRSNIDEQECKRTKKNV